jgi:putative chitinase
MGRISDFSRWKDLNESVTLRSSGRKISHSYGGEKAKNIELLINLMEKIGITNPNSQVGILSVISKESNFIPKSENLNYSAKRLPEVWSKFSTTGRRVQKGEGSKYKNQLADEYAGSPEKLANFIYANRIGNGPESSGDGWKYRGRGFNQITGRANYEKYGDLLGLNLIDFPDLLNDPKIAARAALAFFVTNFDSKGIDPNSFQDKEGAVETFAQANAGWRSNAKTAITNAKNRSLKFEIVSV